MEEIKKISQEAIETFINGHDPMERIVNLLYNYSDDYITVVYRNEKDQKCKRNEKFYPFCWATLSACQKLCAGNREELKRLMTRFKIGVKKLSNVNIEGEVRHEFDDGYLFMFFAKSPMSYKDFLAFFKIAGNPIYSKSKDENSTQSKSESHQYLIVTPQEQFLIATGKRFFKGYDDYDQVLKMTFDLETTGVDLRYDKIIQVGIRMNRPFPACPNGFEKIITITGDTEEDRDACELWAIEQMFKMIHTFQPDIITAHNGENFDWNMIINACERLGTSISEVSSKYFNGESIRKEDRESILKLGGEMETYYQTIVPGIIVTDSLHAVRRAQALDSNMLEANLKYVTKYSKLNKPNRVYTPGEKISQIWADKEEHYAFNEENGDWYLYNPNAETSNTEFKRGKEGDKAFIMYTRNYIADGYELKSGQYIVERYLFDDLYECDKVEHRYNTPNFLICKMLPVPYKKCTTMGTAGQWKALMLAWSYENNLAIPMFGESKSFTGGLSRLLKVGFVDNVAKFDYNSLYPSIILTWAISDSTDLMKTMLHFLEHVLSQREKYKKLKKVAGKKADAIKEKLHNHDYMTPEEGKELQKEMMKWKQEESFNDKKQLPLKILGNSFFGSYGAPNVFPFGSLKCAEQTTCTGRQCLRLMISHFSNLGYEPIVGDSFTPDTPVFIKYNYGKIDIKPISELIDENSIEIDELGREYDYSKKDYKVLCRSGWVEPSYIYRHKTDKEIYEVSEDGMKIEVTEDHSLFNGKQEKIKPSEINKDTQLEYYQGNIANITTEEIRSEYVVLDAENLASGKINRVPMEYLNNTVYNMKLFYDAFMKNWDESIHYSKTCIAGIQYLKRNIGK